ncbi:AMP-binding protein [Maritimibacter sp. DP07]|uniref:3-methylmercaptopropionyl-CoA ligase n=1 Tax=Maritimibacter harenae TaxID=2606218 RepID=A0A845MA07_9RHOB|nr:AMP-binding protein [Maritimibacter harenae]MZR13421.1 AMP-binding protein [Maritimibacter harenae]
MFTVAHLAPCKANTTPLTPLRFLERTLEVHPDRPAVAWRQDRWTYREFGELVARLADWLTGQGVGPGDVVSMMLTNRPELLAAHFAVPAVGAVLNAINTRITAEEVGYILDHAGSKLLIVEASTDPKVTVDVPVHTLSQDPESGEGLNLFSGATSPLDLTRFPHAETDALALNYTSGTTGRPKGVVYTHRGAALNALGNVLAMGFGPDSRLLWTLPMFHCNGWSQTWAIVAAGGLSVCLDRADPALILEEIGRHGVTHMSCAPVVLYMLLNTAPEDMRVSVKVATGGAAPTPTLIAGLGARGFELVHLYGLTESYGPNTLNDPMDKAFGSTEDKAAYLARQGHGHILAGRARVVDETGADVPADGATMGEIVLTGNTIMAGYYRDPEATEAAFAGGHFHTGDLAVKHPDGQIEIRDRAKDVIITGGENVSSIEIENVLHAHPDVLLAAVVAVPDEKWGETPCAFVETRTGATVIPADLDAFCRGHLSGFKRPKHYVFGELPKTATGKIQKFVLREQAKDTL